MVFVDDVNDPPRILTTIPAVVEAFEDRPFTLNLTAIDRENNTITWSDTSDLFTIGPESGVIFFTPLQSDVGSHDVTIKALDEHNGVAKVSFRLVIMDSNDAPFIVAVLPASGATFTEGEAVRFMACATDEDGDSLRYSWTEGERVLGTGPELMYSRLTVGAHVVKVTVTDGNATAEREIALDIKSVTWRIGGPTLTLAVVLVAVTTIVSVGLWLSRKRRRGRDA
jgi:hypothetical protein